MQIQISFNDSITISKEVRQANQRRFFYLLEEIDDSSPTALSAQDFEYYAEALSHSDPTGKEWTANEVRWRMLENSDYSSLDLIDSFGYSNDDIIDFF